MELIHYEKIVLAGGTGYLGTALVRYFRHNCRSLVVLSRNARRAHHNVRYVVWDGRSAGAWTAELEGADCLVNLCGKSVDCRYTEAARTELYRSRLEPTQALGDAVRACRRPPALWINLASATIYRHAEDRPQTEAAGDLGDGFSVDVCQTWEGLFFGQETPGTRKAALRASFVLGRGGGAFPKLLGLVMAGLGGRQGGGRQMVSWIHEQDFCRIVEFLMMHPELEGVFNTTAPRPIANRAFMQVVRRSWNIPFGLPAPAWLLGLGARLIGTEPELILKSRWVLPARLTEAGFRFYFESLPAAINDLASRRL